MPKFVGPVLIYKPGRPEDLWFVSTRIGKTVVKKDGSWLEIVTPQGDFLATCDVVLRGGYTHTITSDLATELTAAGYGAYITES
jgi:hypothetical protein